MAQNRTGKKYKVSGSGLLGRALQHELDHLDGKLYIDYLDSMDELIAVGQGDEDEDAEVRERDERARVTARPPGVGRVRTVFLGSGAFAVPSLRALATHGAVELVGDRHRAAEAGRARAAPRALARRTTPRRSAAVLTPPRLRDPEAVAAILDLETGSRRARRLRPDRAGRRSWTRAFGALNLHPSLLPRHRGASPVPAAIAGRRSRDRRDPDADGRRARHGPDRRRSSALPLAGAETAPELEARLARPRRRPARPVARAVAARRRCRPRRSPRRARR